MNRQKKLSVILPIYRASDTIERCFSSISAQQYQPLEIILVDDGSPDDCPERCDNWAEMLPSVRVVHKSNGGLSDARNAGLEVATGDYVTFIDADDELTTETYCEVMKVINKHPEIDLIEYPVVVNYGCNDAHLLSFTPQLFHSPNDYWVATQAYRHAYAWNKIYRRELFSEVNFPKGLLFEDIHTLPHLLQKTHVVAVTDRGCYRYWKNTQGITATAGGKELLMLLQGHMNIINNKWFTVDDLYYLHVLNIQIDVCRLLNTRPQLPPRHLTPRPSYGLKFFLKSILLNLIGISNLCKTINYLHHLRRSRL